MKRSFLVRRLSAALLALALLLTLSAGLAGCSKMENVSVSDAPQQTTAADPGVEKEGVLSSGETVEYYIPASRKNPGDHEVTLFIWNIDSWKTVQWKYRDNLTVQKLLEGLAYVTNWDLSTADVKIEKEKVTIRWSKMSSLYTGLPAKQAKDYMVFSQEDLDAVILDSIKQTITENLGPSYSIYYAASDGTDLVLPNVDTTIPAAYPYTAFGDY